MDKSKRFDKRIQPAQQNAAGDIPVSEYRPMPFRYINGRTTTGIRQTYNLRLRARASLAPTYNLRLTTYDLQLTTYNL
jgi:hypothetical protein